MNHSPGYAAVDSHELNHLRDLALQLNIFRNTSVMCDVTIKVQDRSFPAHKSILAAASGYFRAMFTVDCKEKNESEVTLIQTEGLSWDSFQTLLEFIYAGKMRLSIETVSDTLACACYLHVKSAIQACFTFIETDILKPGVVEKYIGLYELANNNVLDSLRSLIIDYMAMNFCSLVKVREFQKDITSTCLEKILLHNDVTVFAEQEVLHAIAQWLTQDWGNRKEHAISLLGKVRLCIIPVTDIIHIFASEPIKGHLHCRDLYEDVLKYHALGKKHFSCDLISECDLIATPRTAKRMIVASNVHTDCLDVENSMWYSMTKFEDAKRNGHCLVLFSGSIIIAGGNGGSYLNDIMTLDTKSMKWVHLTRMKQARSNFVLFPCKKGLYAIGGYNSKSNFIVDVERIEFSYDGKWIRKSVSPLPVAFKSKIRPSVVSHKGRLLVTGMSATEDRHCGPILIYTPATNKWEVLTEIPQIGLCDAVYLVTESDRLFITSFTVADNNRWQPRVQECDLACDDTQTGFTIAREVKQNEFAETSLKACQIGVKVFVMCNDFALETLVRVEPMEVIFLDSYSTLKELLDSSAVNVLTLDWHKIGLQEKTFLK